jgi:glycosyltransferase involved in cell wall biosynthesis
MIKISVVVPVFNSAKYLEKCIESLLIQTLSSMEFIFINDGSTDESLSILEKYALNNPKIKIINQVNQGVSAARNTGLAIANGDYIGFVDADDFVDSNYFSQLFEIAVQTNSQIVISGFNKVIDEKIVYNQPVFEIGKQFQLTEIKQYILPFFIEQDLMNTVWNKLYESKLIRINNVRFPLGFTNGEDGLFNIQAFSKSQSAYFIDCGGYYYRDVYDSATKNIKKYDYFNIALDIFNLDYEEQFGIVFQDIDLDKLKSKRFINSIISLIHIYLNPKNGFSFSMRYHYVKRIVSHPEVEKIINVYWDVFYVNNKSKYHKYILNCIKYKSVFGLLALTTYSNFRNSKM